MNESIISSQCTLKLECVTSEKFQIYVKCMYMYAQNILTFFLNITISHKYAKAIRCLLNRRI